MNDLIALFSPGNTSLTATILLYSFVIALGVYLGKLKVYNVSLGVTFVLFVGILMGHFGYVVDTETLHFVRDFGLILFIFSIGLQVGPGFFSSFKKSGMLLNGLAVSIVAIDVIVVLSIFFFKGETDMPALVGIMSGAVTNTPGLAAAQQTVENLPEAVDTMAMGYAATYPLGVVGIILVMLIIKAIFKINVDEEVKRIEAERDNSMLKPHILNIEVTNPLLEGKTIRVLNSVINCDFVVSRLMRPDGEVALPRSTTVVHVGDRMRIVMSAQDEDMFKTVVGKEIEMDWESTPTQVLSRRILITKSEYNGVQIGRLRLHAGYNLNATRVNRAGVDLVASPNLRLQMGDRLTVVGNIADINRLAEKLGNSMKRLHEPNMITIFIGIILGLVLGSLNLGYGIKLGIAGGPLIVAILLSRFGYKIKLTTYTSSSASLLMRELGICLFLASVGIAAGKDFAATVFNSTGAMWVLWGFVITVVPLLIVGCFARWKYKINILTLAGVLSGSYTDPPALAYATNSTNNDEPAVAYSTVYPLTMFLRVVVAQLIVLCLL
ncbi:MAG: putative transporter [Muribaculaceae bacterium]|nr:putative transporter [Muribaculaceae bacterium]MBR5745148.1 putative transporter [Muribaculaceae bacterium]